MLSRVPSVGLTVGAVVGAVVPVVVAVVVVVVAVVELVEFSSWGARHAVNTPKATTATNTKVISFTHHTPGGVYDGKDGFSKENKPVFA